jgi:uncharacterized protein with HEPN domain
MASNSDVELALEILRQIAAALTKIRDRASRIDSAEAFSASPEGEERLDALCMLFIAVGEALKNLDKVTGGSLLSNYPEIDWKGAMGFRDVIAHQYFDIDPEQVWWICTHEVAPLSGAINKMIAELTLSGARSSNTED